jgi:hypothetical protein
MNKTPTLENINVADPDIAPARSLQVQLLTRIATQPLHYRSGDEETAVKSIHDLFDMTRTLLMANPNALAFEVAAVCLLNNILRPYTARWHRWMVDNCFSDERSRRQFRYELKLLQPRLVDFADLLGLLVKKDTPGAKEAFNRIVATLPPPNHKANLGRDVPAGFGPEVDLKNGPLQPNLTRRSGMDAPEPSAHPPPQGSDEFAKAEEINEAEGKFIQARRRALGLQQADDKVALQVKNATGLCLSGGGIRSATFCLGIVQVLARQEMLQQLDYLSTVSGGGYLGSFLTSFLGTSETDSSSPAAVEGDKINEVIHQAFQPLNGHESAAIRHLRNNSRYLLNGGVWGRVKVVGLLVTGILSSILLLLPIPLGAALVYAALRWMGFWEPVWSGNLPFYAESVASTLLLWLAWLLIAAWFLLPVVRNCARGKRPDSTPSKLCTFWEAGTLVLMLLTLAAGILLVTPMVFTGIEWLRLNIGRFGRTVDGLANSKTLVLIVAALGPVVSGLLAARLKAGKGKQWATLVFGLSGPLFYLVVFVLVGHHLTNGSWRGWPVVRASGALTLWVWLFVDINDFSPHGYYRARLCECYLIARKGDDPGRVRKFLRLILHGTRSKPGKEGKSDDKSRDKTGVPTRLQLPLSRINQTGAAPYHLVNTAANLPASHEPNLRGRDCDFFTFSRDYCGGPVCGYFKTTTLENLDSHLDLGTAMAISGAAASSNMGVKTLRRYRFLITLLNVRLGYWLRNPVAGPRRPWNAPGPVYFFRELTGWMHENSSYLNLSDGGHIENLALYELLRRRCKFIVVVDGGMEPGMECADLMLAQRYAQIDLGVQFNLDLADLALDSQRRSRAYAVFGKIRYSPRIGESDDLLGWLVYIKLACTGGEPGYIVDYRRQNPDFPHQSTADQIYDEAQFEAYRRLGECAAESLFRGELTGKPLNPQTEVSSGKPQFKTLSEWFQALANNLLPDNDPAFDDPSTRQTSA